MNLASNNTKEQEDYLRNDNKRTDGLIDSLNVTKDPEELFLEVLEVIGDKPEPVPLPGRYYTFLYKAKTYRIEYDAHPLIACTGVYKWGFTGLNYHWGKVRQYTWEECQSLFYTVYPNEIEDLRSIPYQNIKLNS